MLQQRHHPFQISFWSPTASTDPTPNFHIGFDMLHRKLNQSIAENRVIVEYVQQRIAAERAHATTLSSVLSTTTLSTTSNPFEFDIGFGLKKCFETICSESKVSAKLHLERADKINTNVVRPLQRFASRYEHIIEETRTDMEYKITQFDAACQDMQQTKTEYVDKCQAIMKAYPDFVPEKTLIKLGSSLSFLTREQAWQWFECIFNKKQVYESKKEIRQLLKQHYLSDYETIIQKLLALKFLRQENGVLVRESTLLDDDELSVNYQQNPKSNSGFFNIWGSAQQRRKEEIIKEMLATDKAYHTAVVKVERMRIDMEELLYQHFEEMESLELERIQTVKEAFLSMMTTFADTISKAKEFNDDMMLYQETLKADKDVQFIVEQYSTGQFCPKPILYHNFFDGITLTDQLFGVPLEQVTLNENTQVPQFIIKSLNAIELALLKLYDEEKRVVWTASLPLERVHAAREELNSIVAVQDDDAFVKLDVLLLASLVRLYLLELPECLFTFELYEPCKLIYANYGQDESSRLSSISRLLTTLPSANYYTIKALFSHFNKLLNPVGNTATKDDTQLIISISRIFSYILMRPQTESNVSLHERHPQKLLEDLIKHFDAIFTEESNQAHEKNSTRPSIIIPSSNCKKIPSSSATSETSLLRSSASLLSSLITSSSVSLPIADNHKHQPAGMVVIPKPSLSTLFEDPDDFASKRNSTSGTSSVSTTTTNTLMTLKSPSSINTDPQRQPHGKEPLNDAQSLTELASVDSFFFDDED
ncbi:hypothetical protein BDF20DRAFT_910085 [Mycotypha africana]|uniref:uncharacterized protein n=1 Tax=Mycotypha africana TaxID=64632 RepID=UPI002300AE10|nr:uncharacterized protein BDF20DRAFT_910085 [Mycotypha africana]KAI8987471.1 hypothetical protein BDF20DRAFT_910085 [Mycotypha africana]